MLSLGAGSIFCQKLALLRLLDCFSTVERGLLFIQKQVGVHKAAIAGSTDEEDDANFKDILAAVKFVVQILSTAAAKAQKQ